MVGHDHHRAQLIGAGIDAFLDERVTRQWLGRCDGGIEGGGEVPDGAGLELCRLHDEGDLLRMTIHDGDRVKQPASAAISGIDQQLHRRDPPVGSRRCCAGLPMGLEAHVASKGQADLVVFDHRHAHAAMSLRSD